MDQRSWKPLIRACLESDESTGVCEVLRKRSGGRGMLMRLSGPDETSVIVKAWASRNRKEHVKRLLGLSMARREWRVHRRIERAGLAVPRPLMYFHTRCSDGRRFEVVVVEDLGETESGVPYLKRLVAEGNDDAIIAFEDSVISMTTDLLQYGILDVDHQLGNILVDGQGNIIRIDFECARHVWLPHCRVVMYATMLDRLLRSHLHGVYPETERSQPFMSRVVNALSTPRIIRRLAVRFYEREVRREQEATGIEYSVPVRL